MVICLMETVNIITVMCSERLLLQILRQERGTKASERYEYYGAQKITRH
jgi:hypothetical protein